MHTWKRCSSCKKDIPFNAQYYLCSVSTCRHKRTGLRFCSVPCWDAHLGYANHRSAYAEEATAPSEAEYQAEVRAEQAAPMSSSAREPVRKVVDPNTSRPQSSTLPQHLTVETLVVVSKVKALINERSEFSTSQCCIDALTQRVVEECLKGIEKAKAAGRKTVMGRDIRG